jgi:hypothetical protein
VHPVGSKNPSGKCSLIRENLPDRGRPIDVLLLSLYREQLAEVAQLTGYIGRKS